MTASTARLLFFGKFVLAAAVTFAIWKSGGAGAYGYVVLVPVTILSPLLTGYQVVLGTGAHGLTAFFEGGGQRIEVPFVLHEALAGVIPFIALMLATGRQTWQQLAKRLAIGLAVLYVAHVGVMLLSPLLVTPHERWVNRIIDVTYGFYAVAGFVGLPFSLWMIFTRPWEGDLMSRPTAMSVATVTEPAPSASSAAVPKPAGNEPKRQVASGKRRKG